MKELAELITAIAALLWPVVIFLLVLMFRHEITDVSRRLRKGKILGHELELGESLDHLKDNLDAAKKEASLRIAAEPARPQIAAETEPSSDMAVDSESARIIEIASASPRLAIIMTANAIESHLKELLFSQGKLNVKFEYSLPNATHVLKRRGILSDATIRALVSFLQVRDQFIHGAYVPSDSDTLRAIDLGLGVLRLLEAAPRQITTVVAANLPLYGDSEAKNVIEGATGVMLEMLDSATDKSSTLVYPTTQTYYRLGQQVAWEWVSTHEWERCWYEDPDTGELKVAFDSSLEFVGRPLDKV
jgi:hypothetical protein